MKLDGLTISSATLKMEATFFRETFVFAEETSVARPRPPYLKFTVFMHLSKALYYQKVCHENNHLTECMDTEGSGGSIFGVKRQTGRCISKCSVLL